MLALFWTFGAPGTPPNTGPQNLPGQDLEAYLPVWRPFAPDSTLAVEEYPFTQDYPEGFEPVPEDLEVLAAEGGQEVVDLLLQPDGALRPGGGLHRRRRRGRDPRTTRTPTATT